MPPSTTRRRLLHAVSGLAASTAVAGCNQLIASETTNTTTSGTTASPRALVEVTRESHLAKAWTLPQDTFRFPKGEAVPLADLDTAVRAAVRTAIETPPYTTTDPSKPLREGIDDVTLVTYEGTTWTVDHTLPTVTVRVDTNIPESEPVPERTVAYGSDVVESSEAIEDLVSTIAPHGVETEARPYVTTHLDPEVRDFLDRYDYIETPTGVGEIVVSRTERTPPHTVRARKATDEERYGRPVREATTYGPPTRDFIDRVLESDRKTPGNYQERIHTIYPDDVPWRFARDLDHGSNYVRVGDAVYGFDTRHVHWAELPLEFQATIADDGATPTGPVAVELAVQNTSTRAVTLQMAGLSPFGVLWAYGPGGEYVLWNDAYESSENVAVKNGRIIPASHSELTLAPGQTATAGYRLGHDRFGATAPLQSGTYEVLGTIWAKWPTYEGAEKYDWRSQLFPYTLTIELS